MSDSEYIGFAYGEVTQDSNKKKGQHIGGLARRTENGLSFDDHVRPGISELGFSARFHKTGAPYSQDEIVVLKQHLETYFAHAEIVGDPVIQQWPDKRPDEHHLSITFYSPASKREAFEAGIVNIEKAYRNDIPEPARKDGKEWADSLGSRTGRQLNN